MRQLLDSKDSHVQLGPSVEGLSGHGPTHNSNPGLAESFTAGFVGADARHAHSGPEGPGRKAGGGVARRADWPPLHRLQEPVALARKATFSTEVPTAS